MQLMYCAEDSTTSTCACHPCVHIVESGAYELPNAVVISFLLYDAEKVEYNMPLHFWWIKLKRFLLYLFILSVQAYSYHVVTT